MARRKSIKHRRQVVINFCLIGGLLAAAGLLAQCVSQQLPQYPKPARQNESAVLLPLPESMPAEIRVLLKALSAQKSVTISTGNEKLLDVWIDEEAPQRDSGPVSLLVSGDGITLSTASGASLPVARGLEIRAVREEGGAGVLRAGSAEYEGALSIQRVGDSWQVMSRVTPEEYVRGSLPSEMPLSWPEEALKAQSVAIRSYAMFAVLAKSAISSQQAWDVDDTTSYLRYAGVGGERGDLAQSWRKKASAAAEATQGEYLTFEGKLLKAYFHACSGGHTASCSTAFGQKEIGPLAGTDLGSYGSACALYRWTREFTRAQVEAAVKQVSGKSVTVTDLRPSQQDSSGYAWSVIVKGPGGSFAIRAADLQASLGSGANRLPSNNYDVSSGGTFTFSGRGWAHGVGLDQWASCAMAKDGMGYTEILGRMYSGASIRRL